MEKNQMPEPGAPDSDEYMTVGEAAKEMGVTVRTLQYYDKIGLLPPSGESAGGRRLYTHKDLIKLHQILSLKSLGFSLDDIRKRLIPLDTPADVARALSSQEENLRQKIEELSEALNATRQLKAEVLQMHSVDFKKYADIIVNLQMKNEYYFLIKRFDDDTLDYIRSRFDRESGISFLKRFNRLNQEILSLQKAQIPPESEKSQALTKQFWDLILEFTDGDMSMLPKLMEIGNFIPQKSNASAENPSLENQWNQMQALVNGYLEQALEIYFSRLGGSPFQDPPLEANPTSDFIDNAPDKEVQG